MARKNAKICTLYIYYTHTVITHRIKTLAPSKSLVLGKKISLQKNENIFRKLKSKGPSTRGVLQLVFSRNSDDFHKFIKDSSTVNKNKKYKLTCVLGS